MKDNFVDLCPSTILYLIFANPLTNFQGRFASAPKFDRVFDPRPGGDAT